MDWPQFIVQWLHVLLGIIWFGAVLYNAVILIPALTTLPLARQREVGAAIGAQAIKVIRPVSMAVIALGILRGTVFGPIKGLGDLGSAYGITWSIALVVAVITFVYAERLIIPALDRLQTLPEAEALDTQGQPTPRLVAIIDDVKRKTIAELGLFFVIFTSMILMRFGL